MRWGAGILSLNFIFFMCFVCSNSVFAKENKSSDRNNLNSPGDLIKWQENLRKDLTVLLKIDDLNGKRVPFSPEIISTREFDNYISQEIEINSTEKRRIRIVMTVPSESCKSPFPAVVCIAGHGSALYDTYQRNSIYNGFAEKLASEGYVTIAVSVSRHEVYESGRTLMGERLWDLKRCVDYLESLKNVDKKRIGCAGLSLGGEMSMWLGAMDTRISAVLSAGFLTYMDRLENNHCLCWKFPGLREKADFPDIYSLIAPRPLLCQNGLREEPTQFPPDVAMKAMEDIRRTYGIFSKADNACVVVHEGGHVIDIPSLMFFFNSCL